MRRYNKFVAIFMSVYSTDLYRDVLKRWEGFGMTYIFLLTCLVVTPTAIIAAIMFDNVMFHQEYGKANMAEEIIGEIADQVPKMEFRNNTMRVIGNETQMIYISVADSKVPLALIDHDATAADFQDGSPLMILSKHELLVSRASGGVKSIPWTEFNVGNLYLDPPSVADYGIYALQQIQPYRPQLTVAIGAFLWSMAMLVVFLWRMIQAFLLGVLAMAISSLMDSKWTYVQSVRMSCICMTPAILCDILLALTVQDTMMTMLFVVIAMGYISYAIHANRSVDDELEI